MAEIGGIAAAMGLMQLIAARGAHPAKVVSSLGSSSAALAAEARSGRPSLDELADLLRRSLAVDLHGPPTRPLDGARLGRKAVADVVERLEHMAAHLAHRLHHHRAVAAPVAGLAPRLRACHRRRHDLFANVGDAAERAGDQSARELLVVVVGAPNQPSNGCSKAHTSAYLIIRLRSRRPARRSLGEGGDVGQVRLPVRRSLGEGGTCERCARWPARGWPREPCRARLVEHAATTPGSSSSACARISPQGPTTIERPHVPRPSS